MNKTEKYGPWALVAGGAEGLGLAFVEQAAALGLNVMMIDNQVETLNRNAQTVRTDYPVEVRTLGLDLGDPDFMQTLLPEVADIEIGLLICVAAVGHTGPFLDTDMEKLMLTVDVNVRATLQLVHHFCQPMALRGHGGVILLSSNSAYQGTPYVANYAATKAFNLVLGEALWYELAKYGVDALAFVPGATNTPSLRSTNPNIRFIMEPEVSAAHAMAALGKTPSARPGLRSRLETFFLTKLLSRRTAVKLAGKFIDGKLDRTIPESGQ
jgi:short-subunit dehydrogenase